MSKVLAIPTAYNRFRGHIYRILRWPYLVAAIAGYFFVALLVLLYLKSAPVYKSQMALVLPGTGATNNVQLDEVGQVSSKTDTPFAGRGFNPRVNYKEMLGSESILHDAARRANTGSAQFGKPRIVLTEQTSILEITMTGPSADHAQARAWALYDALQSKLNHLRADETLRRDESVKAVLREYREKLNSARENIVFFQERSLLVSTEQMEQLTVMLTNLKEKQMYVRSEAEQLENFVMQLAQDLGVSPALAGQAFALQSDMEFRSYLKELDASAAKLTSYTAKWGDKHPKVNAERKRYEKSRFALLDRSRSLLGVQTGDLLYTMDLESSPRRAELFSTLVESFSKQRGIQAQLSELKNAESLLTDKIKVYAREAAELEKLERDFELAEAIYTSAAARLEASKADIFASYPIVQLMMPPSLPTRPAGPKTLVAIIAGLAGFFFITMTILVIWQRAKLIALLLNKHSNH